MQEYDMRKYSRGRHFVCTAKVSGDWAEWDSVLVNDISSEGLNFTLAREYEVGQILQVDLHIKGFLSEFKLCTQSKIRHKRPSPKGFVYGIEFENVSHDVKIRIDQNIAKDRPVMGNPYMRD